MNEEKWCEMEDRIKDEKAQGENQSYGDYKSSIPDDYSPSVGDRFVRAKGVHKSDTISTERTELKVTKVNPVGIQAAYKNGGFLNSTPTEFIRLARMSVDCGTLFYPSKKLNLKPNTQL